MSTGASTISVNGPTGRLSVELCGATDAQPILFVHPANARAACWRDVAALLSGERACVAPDLRGHGGSTRRGPLSVSGWVDDCWAVIEALELDRVHLVGASVGAAVVVELAARHPDQIATVTTLGGAFLPAPEANSPLLEEIRTRGLVATMHDAAIAALAPDTPTALVARVEAEMSRNDADTFGAIWCAANATDVRPWLEMLSAPCLSVVGEHDCTCTPAESAWLSEATGGELRVLPGVGHLPMYEAPQEVAALIAAHTTDRNSNHR